MTQNSLAFLKDLETRMGVNHGLTPEGVKWILKALHPASSMEYASIPDSSYFKTARSELRGQSIITAPGDVGTAWDLFIWRFPYDSSPVYACSQNAATGPPIIGDLTTTVMTVNPLQPISSSTITTSSGPQTATFFATLASGSAKDTGVGVAGSIAFLEPTGGYESFRHSYASMTCYMTASSLNDQGTVFAAQSAPDYVLGSTFLNVLTGGSTAAQVQQAMSFVSMPYDEDDMALKNPRYYTAPARDGCYIPLRLSGPTQPFSRRTFASVATGSVPGSGVVSGLDVLTTSVSGSLFVSSFPVGYRVSALDTTDFAATGGVGSLGTFPGRNGTINDLNAFVDNSHVSLVIFRGLSPSASITVKYIAGMEFEVDTDSPMRQFVTVPPRYDPRAIELYYRIVQEMPDVYPASWNSLGTILAAITSVASRVLPFLKPILIAGASGAAAKGMELLSGAQSNMAAPQRVVTPKPPSVHKAAVVMPKKKAKNRRKAAAKRK